MKAEVQEGVGAVKSSGTSLAKGLRVVIETRVRKQERAEEKKLVVPPMAGAMVAAVVGLLRRSAEGGGTGWESSTSR